MPVNEDFRLDSYIFDLPEDRIAQWPAPERADSRLMVLRRSDSTLSTDTFHNILDYLPPECLLVANNSRVVPVRLISKRKGGGKLETLLLTPLPLLVSQGRQEPFIFPNWHRAEAEMLLRPAKRIREGELISLEPNLAVEILERGEFGRFRVNLVWQGDLLSILERRGLVPLPPYIKRSRVQDESAGTSDAQQSRRDRERYQTVYAREDKAGSAAAPTAGLHFTPAIFDALRASGREWAEVTLYVGYGTFSPVRCDDIRQHDMHREYVELDEKSADAIARAKASGRPVIAVGTTSCRTLEGIHAVQGGTPSSPPQPFKGWVNHFLYPGKEFNVIDGMITNFHLPGSSLLMLVSALAGRERILAAYQEAIDKNFRFFSYGDAMLIL